jgi:hypothetical protein
MSVMHLLSIPGWTKLAHHEINHHKQTRQGAQGYDTAALIQEYLQQVTYDQSRIRVRIPGWQPVGIS